MHLFRSIYGCFFQLFLVHLYTVPKLHGRASQSSCKSSPMCWTPLGCISMQHGCIEDYQSVNILMHEQKQRRLKWWHCENNHSLFFLLRKLIIVFSVLVWLLCVIQRTIFEWKYEQVLDNTQMCWNINFGWFGAW